MKVFDDLITRGLKEVLIVISDDFPGIIDAVSNLLILFFTFSLPLSTSNEIAENI